MSVNSVLQRDVETIRAEDSVRSAASRMQQRSIGCLVVIDGAEQPIGILTDRDLTLRVLADGRDPETTKVSSVMTNPAGFVDETTPIESALRLMRQGGFRRLPVIHSATGHLAGIVTLDDILVFLSEEIRDIGHLLGAEASPMSAR